MLIGAPIVVSLIIHNLIGALVILGVSVLFFYLDKFRFLQGTASILIEIQIVKYFFVDRWSDI